MDRLLSRLRNRSEQDWVEQVPRPKLFSARTWFTTQGAQAQESQGDKRRCVPRGSSSSRAARRTCPLLFCLLFIFHVTISVLNIQPPCVTTPTDSNSDRCAIRSRREASHHQWAHRLVGLHLVYAARPPAAPTAAAPRHHHRLPLLVRMRTSGS